MKEETKLLLQNPKIFSWVLLSIAIISLWASITNLIPVSVLFAITIFLLPYLFFQNSKIPNVTFYTLGMLTYFAISGLLINQMGFFSYNFLRRDGNVFITLMPLIIFSLAYVKVNPEKLLIHFTLWVSIINLIFVFIYLVTGGTILIYEANIYHFLFTAHNAAGGYLATLSCFTLGIFFTRRKWIAVFSFFSCVLGLYLSDSRGSLLGLLLAIISVFILKTKGKTISLLLSAVVIGVIIQNTYPIWASAGMPTQDFDLGVVDLNFERDATFIERGVYLWPRAIHLWFTSPILGTGFGAYNDIPYNLKGIDHVLSLNLSKTIFHDDGHAHNSYLNILAETGIIGLIFVIFWLKKMISAIRGIENKSCQIALELAVWSSLWSSYTEHRLFTPSQMLPITLFLGVAIASKRWKQRIKECESPSYMTGSLLTQVPKEF